ncbi:tyrosine decarboxylase 1-like [Neltuma alba]|uniref:tyrosine decarboxylase 1-like n=1 Tax=Neltuma alba TaxID=207710 RepID=UPI0010A4B92A|nr:tyrosine decarboxylase 1-like [Prosopis alba]
MNPLDLEEFKRQGYMMIDSLVDYYRNVANFPVLSQVRPGYLRKMLPSSAPSKPEPFETILRDVQDHIVPGITHWQSPNYFAYFPSSSSTAGFMGEMLSTGFGVVGFNWISSPAATELESIVMDWLGQALKLPESFLFSSNVGGGVLLATTCEAILCTLVAARDEKLRHVGKENLKKLVVYGSDQTHSAFQKAAHVAGIHPENLRVIKTNKSGSFALSPHSLRSAIVKDVENGLVPCFICATVGTTTTTAVDPIGPLGDVAKEYGIWVHVDAAYAGGALICPEFRYFIDGIEGVNSFSFNAHKWFFTNLTCCCLWVKDSSSLTNSLSTNPHYLRNKASESNQVIDYKDWQIALSRKFQSLKLWFVLRSYGLDNLRNFLRQHVKMAKTFENLVKQDKRFEIFVPRYFSLVCFRVSPSVIITKKPFRNGTSDHELNGKIINDDDEHLVNEINRKLLDLINGSGKVFMTHGKVEGAFVIRCAIGATLTEEQHVIMAWETVQEQATSILSKLFN